MSWGAYSKRVMSLALSYIVVVSSLSGLVSVKAMSKGHILMDFRHGECNGKVIDHYTLPYSIAELLRDDDYAGYTVDENYDKWLTEIDLSIYDALLIISPWGWDLEGKQGKGFYSEELDAITNYVQNGGGLLLTVDTQINYNNNVPNQVAGLFGVRFFGDFVSTEYIVNYKHPITIDKKDEDLFNPFLLWDAAIETYPPEAVVLVDVVDRDLVFNSSMVGTLRASVSTIYPAMIALEYGNGRAVFGPMNGLTQPWGTACYGRDEPNKMLLNTIEWLVGIAKIKILEAEDKLYRASKAATQTIRDQMIDMARIVASEITGDAYGFVVKRGYKLIPKYFGDMIPTDPRYIELRETADKYYVALEGSIMKVASADPLEKISADWIEEQIDNNLRTIDGLSFEQAIEGVHTQFTSDLCGQLRLKQPTDVMVDSITSDINLISFNIEKVCPKFILDIRDWFDLVEEWEEVGTTTKSILVIGGTVLLIAAVPTHLATLPFAIAALKTAGGITYLQWGSDATEAAFLFLLYRDVYVNEYKVLNTYEGELVKVLDMVEGKTVGGTLPIPKVELTDIYLPEKATLRSLATFRGTITNTCDYDEAARLVVEVKGPSQKWYGPFYSETKAIEIGQSEDFSVDVPLPLFLGSGLFEAQIAVECGIPRYSPQLGIHPPPVYRSFDVARSPYDIYKYVILSPGSSTDVTVLLNVRNLSGSEDTITITDTIPKEIAASVNDVKFVTQPDEIVEDDPVVKWSLDLPDGASADIVYRVHTSLSPEEIEWLIPAATLKSSHDPDQSSLNTIGVKEIIAEDVDILLSYLKDVINGLPSDSFNGGEQAKEVLSHRIEEVRESYQNGDLGGALRFFMDLFVPANGDEPSIDAWITDKDARSLIQPIIDNTASIMRVVALAYDVLPPTTDIDVSGKLGAGGWYASDVTVSLSAADNEGGYGVDKSEYSLDGGITWTDYSGPFTVVEGITTISYRSADIAGNVEEKKQQVVKVDKTHPEARILFDKGASKVIVFGTDNFDGDVSVESLSGLISKTGEETFVYELTDDAGNNMRITFERTALEDKGGDRLSSVRVLEIRYNDGDPIAPVDNNYEAKFVLDKKTGELKHLTCKINVGNEWLMSKYDGKKDETTMTLKDEGRKEEKVTLPGLVIVELVTYNGNINFLYNG